jgi:hypothetical protein
MCLPGTVPENSNSVSSLMLPSRPFFHKECPLSFENIMWKEPRCIRIHRVDDFGSARNVKTSSISLCSVSPEQVLGVLDFGLSVSNGNVDSVFIVIWVRGKTRSSLMNVYRPLRSRYEG